MRFKKGDVVAVRELVPGTFGGLENDWKAGIYQGERNGKCIISYLPVSKDFWRQNEEEVFESALDDPEKYWPWLKGMRMMKVVDNG